MGFIRYATLHPCWLNQGIHSDFLERKFHYFITLPHSHHFPYQAFTLKFQSSAPEPDTTLIPPPTPEYVFNSSKYGLYYA